MSCSRKLLNLGSALWELPIYSQLVKSTGDNLGLRLVSEMGTMGLQPRASEIWVSELSYICRIPSQYLLRIRELLGGIGKHSRPPSPGHCPPNPGRLANPRGRERVMFRGSYVHLFLRVSLKSWPFPKSGAHLLRSMRSLQNASCSGGRNSPTPGAHYCYLCFHLTKGSPGRKGVASSKHSLIGCPFPKGQVLFPVAWFS